MNIIVYTKRGCPWCEALFKYLKDTSVIFEEREVLDNSIYFDEMVKLSNQSKAPTVVIDGKVFADTDLDEISEVLKNK